MPASLNIDLVEKIDKKRGTSPNQAKYHCSKPGQDRPRTPPLARWKRGFCMKAGKPEAVPFWLGAEELVLPAFLADLFGLVSWAWGIFYFCLNKLSR